MGQDRRANSHESLFLYWSLRPADFRVWPFGPADFHAWPLGPAHFRAWPFGPAILWSSPNLWSALILGFCPLGEHLLRTGRSGQLIA